ncbi:amino acid kinase family protein [Archaeoglobus neptunius]|uniref:amino acid kinase family protein n=1 Tax=Archaeoglobus neptunius TaxID=2798580 RepID=UPI0019297C6C|nr:uridylate kinase [Archaeoglobus neptunius]
MIVKVGGSVVGNLEEVFEALGLTDRVCVLPGGWIFADTVRKVDSEFGLSQSASHWMAINAMNMYGHVLGEVGKKYGFSLIEPESFDEIVDGRCILLPYILLRRYDELPHSWDVTSDSIAVWIASKLKVGEVVKVTAAGGVMGEASVLSRVRASELSTDVVDRLTPELLCRYGINMFVCSPKELKYYILRGRANGTLIEGR